MSGVRFILDGKVRELPPHDPTTTVLQWLRGAERRCGTKEGCGEGDCGACTVVLAELHRGAVRLRAVNACLLFLPALDGKALFTVESLPGPGGALHPVQEALVECHGSQCGFCTPGFVMSLFALLEEQRRPSRAALEEALAGNLCRCTGYRPIVDAARRAFERADGPEGRAAREALRGQLLSLRRKDTLVVRHPAPGGRERAWFAPRTVEDAADLLLHHPEATVLSGGTDVGVWVTKLRKELQAVVYLGAVESLAAVEETATHLELGGAASYADALPLLEAHYPDLGALVRRIGSTQIRNLGTVGGNLANASPIGDTPPALLALDATLVLRRGAATREVPLDGFFLGYRKTALLPGELVERVRVPVRSPEREFRAYKVAKRFDQDISAVCAAFAVTLEEGKVRKLRAAYGGVAATPVRARRLEQALTGRPWTPAAVMEASPLLGEDLTPITDLRASREYRLIVAQNLLRKFQVETSGRMTAPTRLVRDLAEQAPEVP